MKIYVKIKYYEHFLFLENFWLLLIFWTLFIEKCQFLVNFDKNVSLPPLSTKITKKCSKFNLELFLDHILSIWFVDGGKNRILSKLPKIDIFHQTKSQKSLTTKKFQKTENTHNKWFSHRFSILDQFGTPKGLPDGPDSPLAVPGLSTDQDGSRNPMDGF